MTTSEARVQIAARLPARLVRLMDAAVADGQVSSRTEYLERAVAAAAKAAEQEREIAVMRAAYAAGEVDEVEPAWVRRHASEIWAELP
ncbi:MAG: hypothetical protein ACT4PP_03145 [Sporichthyaceae bacterium]